ncbi:MAG: hypothetical protein R3348_04585 [Xanthomonadales bacterium]|nr:hypothetical protein [Xanthomonadales bacterium]
MSGSACCGDLSLQVRAGAVKRYAAERLKAKPDDGRSRRNNSVHWLEVVVVRHGLVFFKLFAQERAGGRENMGLAQRKASCNRNEKPQIRWEA